MDIYHNGYKIRLRQATTKETQELRGVSTGAVRLGIIAYAEWAGEKPPMCTHPKERCTEPESLFAYHCLSADTREIFHFKTEAQVRQAAEDSLRREIDRHVRKWHRS